MAADETTGRRTAAIVLLSLVGVAFLVIGWSSISGSFGDSDEGINTSVWAYNSRSLREAGVTTSALGGRRLDGTDYATHPPLIVVETAIAERLAGEHEWVSRAPAWIGSLVAIALLFQLSRALGADWLTAAAATIATAATPMLFVYGIMLDTPVTSFPLGLAVALVWYRDWRAVTGSGTSRTQPVHPRVSGFVALFACLAGWQSGLLVGICGVALAVLAARRRTGALRAALPYLVAAVVGLGLSIGWGLWTYGSLTALIDKFTRRSGSAGGVSPFDVVSFQVPWLFQLLGLAVFGLVACAVALRDEVYRPLAALSMTIVGVYCLLFREAASGHQYWVYWSLLPTLVGLTYVFQAVLRATKNVGLSPAAAGGVLVGLAVLVAAVDIGRGSEAQTLITEGRQPADLVRATPLPPGDAVYYVGQRFRPDSWMLYYTGRHGEFLVSPDDVARLARDQPDAPVFVIGICDEGDPGYGFCKQVTRSVGGDGRPERVVTSGQLARELGVAPAPPVSAGGPPPLPAPKPSAP